MNTPGSGTRSRSTARAMTSGLQSGETEIWPPPALTRSTLVMSSTVPAPTTMPAREARGECRDGGEGLRRIERHLDDADARRVQRVADTDDLVQAHPAQDGDDAAVLGRLFETHHMIPAFRAMMARPFTMACGSP